MNEGEKYIFNRRKIFRFGLGALAAVATPAEAKKGMSKTDSVRLPTKAPSEDYEKGLRLTEDRAIARTNAYEQLLRRSTAFSNGTSEEIIDVLHQGGIRDGSAVEIEPGPNDSLPPRFEAPKLYPQFDSSAPPGSMERYPGLQMTFGRSTVNAVRVGVDTILRPNQFKPLNLAHAIRAGVTLEKHSLQKHDAQAGVVRIPQSLSTAVIDGSYAVACHTSFEYDKGPWERKTGGRVDLSGYVLQLEGRPALRKAIEDFVTKHLKPEEAAALARKLDESFLIVGNKFEWDYLMQAIHSEKTGLGQPVFCRQPNGSFAFCGIVHDMILLPSSERFKRAVFYLVSKPSVVEAALKRLPQ